MAAFDVTTKPTMLNLKPGTTGSIMVVVSNRLGRPIMGLVEGVLTPASAAKWLVSPPDLQRRYEADPAATVNYEFKVAVPKDVADQAAQFKVSVRDVLAPDDSRVEGQTVGVNVTGDKVEPVPKKKIPWWVFAIAGVVVVGIGLGLYFLLRPTGVPDVRGKPEAEASKILTDLGFDTITVTDTLGEPGEDTNRVVRQEPEAKSEIPKKDSVTKAVVVINRPWALVPDVARMRESVGSARLTGAGFVLGKGSIAWTNVEGDNSLISRTNPSGNTPRKLGDTVDITVLQFTTQDLSVCKLSPLKCIKTKIPIGVVGGAVAAPNKRVMTADTVSK